MLIVCREEGKLMRRMAYTVVSAMLAVLSTFAMAFADAPPAADPPQAVAALEGMNAGMMYDDSGRVVSMAPPPESAAEALRHARKLPGLV